MLDHTTVMWQTDVTVKRKNMKNKNNIILIRQGEITLNEIMEVIK